MPTARPLAKHVYFRLLELLGRRGALVRGLQTQGDAIVLNLHKVSPHANPFWNPLHPRLFEALLAFVAREFHVTTIAGLAESPDDRPALVLSFDDGYHDFVEYACPLLERYGLPANQNVIAGCVESGVPPWNVRLYDFLLAAPPTLIAEIALPGLDARLEGRDDRAKMRFAMALSHHLKLRPRSERLEAIAPLEAVMARADGFAGTRMMDADDVRSIAGAHEVGAHSWSHESMGFEPDTFFLDDLDRCRRFFDERLRLPLTIYAFPNGSYRPEQIERLQSRGIDHVLLVDERVADRTACAIPRVTLYGDSAAELRMRAAGFAARARVRVAVLCGTGAHHRALCAKLAAEVDVAAVVLSRNIVGRKSKRWRSRLERRLFARAAARPFDDAWRAMMEHYTSTRPLPADMPTTEVDQINDPRALTALRDAEPDLIVVSGTNIVRAPILDYASTRRGAINLHTGLSPYVKGGPNCTNWCLAEGWFHLIGSTVHWLDPGIDTGPLIATERTPLDGTEDLATLHQAVMEHAHDLYIRVIRALAAGREVPGLPQPEVGDGRTFYTREWNGDAMRRAAANFERSFGPAALAAREDVRTFPFHDGD